MLTKTLSSFEGENMQTQNSALGYRSDYKLATIIDENGHSDRNIDYELKKRKSNRTRTWL